MSGSAEDFPEIQITSAHLKLVGSLTRVHVIAYTGGIGTPRDAPLGEGQFAKLVVNGRRPTINATRTAGADTFAGTVAPISPRLRPPVQDR